MDEVYRGYRIATSAVDGQWIAKITHVRGQATPVFAAATAEEGEAVCASRAKREVDRYLQYLANRKP